MSVQPNDQLLVEAALNAYRLGCRKAVDDSVSRSGERFDQELQSALASRLVLPERLLMRRCMASTSRALMAARRGHLTAASLSFDEAHSTLDAGGISAEGRLVCTSLLLAARAYYEYRGEDYERARASLNEALRIDEILEVDHSLPILHLHRLQLLHNLIRLEIRCRRVELATSLTGRLLAYIASGRPAPYENGRWEFDRLNTLPPELISAMFTQVATEASAILQACDHPTAANHFVLLFPPHVFYCGTGSRHSPRVMHWVRTKRAFLANNHQQFFDELIPFLADGPGNAPTLWHTVALDTVAYCERTLHPMACTLADEIKSSTICTTRSSG